MRMPQQQTDVDFTRLDEYSAEGVQTAAAADAARKRWLDEAFRLLRAGTPPELVAEHVPIKAPQLRKLARKEGIEAPEPYRGRGAGAS